MAARRPARNAGLMSERGLLPIMNVRSRCEADVDDSAAGTESGSFSRGVSTRLKYGARPERVQLAHLLVALALGEEDQAMTLCASSRHRLLHAGQQLAMALDELAADSFDFAAQQLLMRLRR